MMNRTFWSASITSTTKIQGDAHGITSSDHLFTGSQDILDFTIGSVLLDTLVVVLNHGDLLTYDLVDTKDGTDIDTSVNVTRSIQRIENDTAISISNTSNNR